MSCWMFTASQSANLVRLLRLLLLALVLITLPLAH